MSRTVAILLMCGACAAAQPRFSAPLVGLARDAKGHLRAVHGVSGNFMLRDAISGGVDAWAFDGNFGLVKTDRELLTLGANGTVVRRRPAPQTEAVLDAVSAFFPKTAELWQAGPEGYSKVSIEPGAIAGRVIALGATDAHEVQFAVCRDKQLWLLSINAVTGALAHERVPGGAIAEQACHATGAGSLVVMPDRMLLATGRAILIQTTAGVERRIAISASHAARAGEHWVEVEGPDGPARMIRITSEGENVYLLPAPKERQ